MATGLEYIKRRLPDTFTFENVKAITYPKHKAFLDKVIRAMKCIIDTQTGKRAYNVEYRILDTKVHGGLPQSRQRWYCVGIRRAVQVSDFAWPEPIPCKPFRDVTDQKPSPKRAANPNNSEKSDRYLSSLAYGIDQIVDKYNGNPVRETWFVDGQATEGRGRVSKDICPCLTKTRCAGGGYYVTNRGAMLSTSTTLQLQGVSPKRMLKPPHVSSRKFNMAIGNAMTMPVLARVMHAELISVGLLKTTAVDPFAG